MKPEILCFPVRNVTGEVRTNIFERVGEGLWFLGMQKMTGSSEITKSLKSSSSQKKHTTWLYLICVSFITHNTPHFFILLIFYWSIVFVSLAFVLWYTCVCVSEIAWSLTCDCVILMHIGFLCFLRLLFVFMWFWWLHRVPHSWYVGIVWFADLFDLIYCHF